MKTCSKCQETKPLSEFSDIVVRGKSSKRAQCRACIRAYQKALLDAHPERRKLYGASNAAEVARGNYKERNPEKVRESNRLSSQKHRRKSKVDNPQ